MLEVSDTEIDRSSVEVFETRSSTDEESVTVTERVSDTATCTTRALVSAREITRPSVRVDTAPIAEVSAALTERLSTTDTFTV